MKGNSKEMINEKRGEKWEEMRYTERDVRNRKKEMRNEKLIM